MAAPVILLSRDAGASVNSVISCVERADSICDANDVDLTNPIARAVVSPARLFSSGTNPYTVNRVHSARSKE